MTVTAILSLNMNVMVGSEFGYASVSESLKSDLTAPEADFEACKTESRARDFPEN